MTKNHSSLTSTPDIKLGSPDRFGYSWNIFNEILPIHEEQFYRWTKPIPKNWWLNKSFLDVGCGIGRNSYWSMKLGASNGVSIDVDERSLSAARINLAPYPEVKIENRSAYSIEEKNAFDISFSIGVIHHLEFPDLAINEMVASTKPGGIVLVWLYGKENNEWIIYFFNPLRKILFSHAPLWLVFKLSGILTVVLWIALRLGLSHIEYFRLIRKFSFRHLRAIVFDQMIPKIATHYSKIEAIELLERAGLKNVVAEWVNEMSWSVTGQK